MSKFRKLKNLQAFCAVLFLCFYSLQSACLTPEPETVSVSDSLQTDGKVRVRRIGTLSPYAGIWGSSVSRDGKYLAFVDWTTGDLAVHNLAADENIRVTDKGPLHKLVEYAEAFRRFSDDGQRLAYIWDRNGYELWVINLDGSNPRFIYRDPPEIGEMLRAFDWSADGKYVAAIVPETGTRGTDTKLHSTTLQIALIHVADGNVQGLKSWDGPVSTGQRMSFSPDGRFLAYGSPVKGESQQRDIFVLRIGDSQDLAIITHPADDRLFDWSPDGRQFIAPEDRVLNLIDVESGVATPTVTGRRSRFGRWSPDGKAIFYVRQPGLNNGIVQIIGMDMETHDQKVLYHSELPGENLNSFEASPDGQWLAFSDLQTIPGTDGVEVVLMVLPTGGGEPRLLLRISESELLNVVGWTPDSQEILYTQDPKLAANRSATLWRMSVDGGAPKKLELGLNVLNAIRFHPDGQRVAFDSGQRGARIWVMEDVLSVLESNK